MKLNLTPKQIVALVAQSYIKSRGVFKNRNNAEDMLPKTNLEEQIQFLFWVIQMDYSVKSKQLYQRVLKTYNNYPHWITCSFILNTPTEKLKFFIQNNLKPRYINEITKRFRINAEILKDQYDCKAINIVKKSNTATELLHRIKEFRGFGPKLGNFLLRTYVNILKINYDDIDNITQPVDRHDVRLTYEWGFLKDKTLSSKNIQQTKQLWRKACKQAGVSWLVFDKALWLLGSNGTYTGDPIKDFYDNLGLND